MARTVFSNQTWYIPDVDSNRTDTDPVKVLMEPLKARDMLEVESIAARPGMTPETIVRELMETHLNIVAKRVTAVENYTVNGTPIKDGKDLVDRGEKVIIDDIYKALTNLSYLSEGSVKN